MKARKLAVLVLSTLIITFITIFPTVASSATLEYNQNIPAIFGNGNPPQGWVTFTQDNIQLGLRAKNRTDGTTPNDGAGTYSFPTGTAPASTRALWNFEFSVNVGYESFPSSSLVSSLVGPTLSDYTYLLSVDVDPSLGTSYLSYNPLLVHPDNSYGDNSTANGAGVEVGIIAGGTYSLAQNSQNITFFPFNGNPMIDGTYDFTLGIYDTDGLIGETKMTVVVGEGGTKNVPDAGSTLALMSCSIVGLGLARRRIVSLIS